jgi:PPK2 family polyphosphate:nucleotide phosphotransferase
MHDRGIDIMSYRVAPGGSIDLRQWATREGGGLRKSEGKRRRKALRDRLVELQRLLYATRARAVLVIFQAMDAGGKDSTTRRVFRDLNPAAVRVKSFSSPTRRERLQDFLWRIHRHAPRRGHIGIFNRSHYEDVVTVRVKRLQPPEVWRCRYEHINAFERLLADEGTIVLKFFLHISEDYQRERLQRRLDRPDKRWKFDPADLEDRERWGKFMTAYSEAIQRCSTEAAPWYIVPAERKWFRDLVVTRAVVDRLEALDMHYPQPEFDAAAIRVR